MLSEMARLMFLRFRSNDTNIIHAHRVILKSSCSFGQIISFADRQHAYLANKPFLLFGRPRVVRIEPMASLVFSLVVDIPPILRGYTIVERMILIGAPCWSLSLRQLGSRVRTLDSGYLLLVDDRCS